MLKLRWIALFALVVSLPACGPSHKSVYHVHGKVTDADGKPAAGALLVFTRISTEGDKEPVTAAGKADDSGEYTLTTYENGDGAPEGEYVVTITWPGEKKTPGPGVGPDRLNGQFASERTSQIRRKVEKSGPNEMETIKVTEVVTTTKNGKDKDKDKKDKPREIE
jgi:hypothetical protein